MKLVSLTVEGIFSFKNKSHVDLARTGLVLVEGEIDGNGLSSNGAGKTALVDCILLALFKRTSRGVKSVEDIVNWDCDDGEIVLELETNNKLYRSVYHAFVKTNKQTLKIETLSESSNHWKSVADKQKNALPIIESIIGMDYDAFSNSVLFGQGGVSVFIDGGDSDRKKLFTDILGLGVLDKAYDCCKTHCDEIQRQLYTNDLNCCAERDVISQEEDFIKKEQCMQTTISQVREQIKTIELDLQKAQLFENIQTKIKETEQNITHFYQLYGERLDYCDNQVTNAIRSINKVDRSIVTLAETDQKLRDLEIVEIKYKDLVKESQLLYEEECRLENSIRADKRRIAELDRWQNEIMSGESCPICGSDAIDCLDLRLNIKNQTETLTETIKKTNAIKETNWLRRKKIETELEPLREQLLYKVDLKATQVKESEVVSIADDCVKLLIGTVASYISANEEYFRKKNALQTELDNLKKDLPEHFNEAAISYSKTSSEYLKEVIISYSKVLGEYQNELKRIEKAKVHLKQLLETEKSLNEQLIYEQYLLRLFGPNGIKARIIETVVPQLNILANKCLAKTKSSNMKIEFVTTFEKKDKIKDDFKILITVGTSQVSHDIRCFSGGERKKLEFAVRFAVMGVLAAQASSNAQFLILDEPLDGLDSFTIPQIIWLLREMLSQFPLIIAVTHNAAAKEEFDQRITIKKLGRYSTVEVV